MAWGSWESGTVLTLVISIVGGFNQNGRNKTIRYYGWQNALIA